MWRRLAYMLFATSMLLPAVVRAQTATPQPCVTHTPTPQPCITHTPTPGGEAATPRQVFVFERGRVFPVERKLVFEQWRRREFAIDLTGQQREYVFIVQRTSTFHVDQRQSLFTQDARQTAFTFERRQTTWLVERGRWFDVPARPGAFYAERQRLFEAME